MSNRLLHKSGWIAVLAAVMLISACGDRKGSADIPTPSGSASPSSSAVSPSESPSPSPSESPNKKLADEFVQQASSDIAADQLMAQLGRSVAGASPSEVDQMFRAMDEYYVRNLPELEKKFQDDKAQKELSALQFPVTKEKIGGLKNEELRNMVLHAMEGGYKLETTEGSVFPVVDYAVLAALAGGASPAMKDYLTIMASESEHKSTSDGGLVITRGELVKRVIATETYAKQYRDAPEHGKVEQKFVNYLYLYLVGLDNTPIFNFDTFQVLPEVKSDFEQTVAEHPGTVTAKMTSELLDILAKTKGAVFKKGKDGMQVDVPEVKTFRDGIGTKAKEALKSM
ncbi:MAG: hypothetical protein JWR03_1996 [Cohnella sp.]|nr:hypothetical protein [Cohnella sp.]